MASYNGIKVRDHGNWTGTIEGEPALTASGEVVTVVMDDPTTASGRTDYLISQLRRMDGTPLRQSVEGEGLNGGLDKARDFEHFARKHGWSAMARKSPQHGTAVVTADKGDLRIELVWREGKFSYASSRVHTVGSKREVIKSRKIRNASAARKLLQG